MIDPILAKYLYYFVIVWGLFYVVIHLIEGDYLKMVLEILLLILFVLIHKILRKMGGE